MDEKRLFNETLSALVDYANANAGHVSADDVKDYFKNIIKDEAQYTMIYAYLNERKILVDGIENNIREDVPSTADSGKPEESKTSTPYKWEQEEAGIVAMYQDELNRTNRLDDAQLRTTFEQFKSGNQNSMTSLTEHFLEKVMTILPQYQNQGVGTADLIQEGNLAILLTLNSCDNYDQLENLIHTSIHDAMQALIDEQNGNTRIDEHLVQRVNALNDATVELCDTLKREPTLEELSKHLSLPEEEVRTLMKISLDAL